MKKKQDLKYEFGRKQMQIAQMHFFILFFLKKFLYIIIYYYLITLLLISAHCK